MRILLVGNYLPDRQQSMLRFGAMLASELGKAGQEVRVIRPRPVYQGADPGRSLGKWLGYVDKFIRFPSRLRRASAWADVVHICDQAYSPYTRWLQAVPHIVTCHDLLAARCALGEFPGYRTKWSGGKYQQMIVDGLGRAHGVASVSEATRRDLLRLSGLAPSRTSVVPNAMSHPYGPAGKAESAVRLRRLGIAADERFFLHVGNAVWYKNHPGLLRIFQHVVRTGTIPDLRLVIVNSGLGDDLKELIGQSGLAERIRLHCDLEEEDLCVLYSAATSLVFPSLAEGFGWPIIEAQACGCPVFAGNRPPMTEVGGDAAIYFDPEKPDEAARAILENLPRAGRLREAGFANVRRFSADRMVEGYLRLYGNVIGQSGRGVADATAAAGII